MNQIVSIYFTLKPINTWNWAQQLLHQHQIPPKQLIKCHGKPIILDSPFGISWSHSQKLTVIVIAEGAIGIDAEYQRAIHWQNLANRFFPTWRQRRIHCREDFFRHWTQMEAQSKKHGISLFKGRHLAEENTHTFSWQNHCISVSGLNHQYELKPWDHVKA